MVVTTRKLMLHAPTVVEGYPPAVHRKAEAVRNVLCADCGGGTGLAVISVAAFDRPIVPSHENQHARASPSHCFCTLPEEPPPEIKWVSSFALALQVPKAAQLCLTVASGAHNPRMKAMAAIRLADSL